ncbi:MAG: hypoxanthine-guanine phosphoribosyltransferase [Gammaproteobacteria bacterium]|nr:hypoxanthine-guanine phosphoribosyltransferase [Gammaproteobacteria bacterium]
MSVTLQQARQVLESADLIYDARQIDQALDQLANKINTAVAQLDTGDQPILAVCIMNGGLILTGQLLPRLNFPLHVDFIHATRYRNQTSGGELEWKVEPHQSIEGRSLLILDDILDEGYTLDAVVRYCKDKGASHVIPAVMVEKKHKRRTPGIACEFIGLAVEDRYVFGFGMDYKGYHRNLNGIYAVSEQHQ